MIRGGFLLGYPFSRKKNPDSRDIPKVKNPDKISNSRDKNSLDVVRSLSSWAPPLRDISGICRKKIPIHGFLGLTGLSTRIFFGIFSRFSNSDPDPRDFGIFGILHSGFFRDFLEVLKSRSRSPGFRAFRDFSI